PHPDRPDFELLASRLCAASQRAQEVEHHLIVQCFGTVAKDDQLFQLSEFAGADLETFFRRLDSPRLAARTAVWVVRQVAEALIHAHTLGVIHGALDPAHIVMSPTGDVKIDFGLFVPERVKDPTVTDYVDLRYTRDDGKEQLQNERIDGSQDVYAASAILFELLTGRTVAETKQHSVNALSADVPGTLDRLVHEALAAPKAMSARKFRDGLEQVFYADFNANDVDDGHERIRQWLQLTRRITPTEGLGTNDSAKGDFTRVLEERDRPVEPQDFSHEDFASSARQWATTSHREAPTVAVPPPAEVFLTSISQPPSMSLTPSNARLRRPKPPSMLLWIAMGFTVTYLLILLWSWLAADRDAQPRIDTVDTTAGPPAHSMISGTARIIYGHRGCAGRTGEGPRPVG
ncbi:MAG: protein kinase, partial [Myxococcota bacterium]